MKYKADHKHAINPESVILQLFITPLRDSLLGCAERFQVILMYGIKWRRLNELDFI